jgi:hypothetical protein
MDGGEVWRNNVVDVLPVLIVPRSRVTVDIKLIYRKRHLYWRIYDGAVRDT